MSISFHGRGERKYFRPGVKSFFDRWKSISSFSLQSIFPLLFASERGKNSLESFSPSSSNVFFLRERKLFSSGLILLAVHDRGISHCNEECVLLFFWQSFSFFLSLSHSTLVLLIFYFFSEKIGKSIFDQLFFPSTLMHCRRSFRYTFSCHY